MNAKVSKKTITIACALAAIVAIAMVFAFVNAHKASANADPVTISEKGAGSTDVILDLSGDWSVSVPDKIVMTSDGAGVTTGTGYVTATANLPAGYSLQYCASSASSWKLSASGTDQLSYEFSDGTVWDGTSYHDLVAKNTVSAQKLQTATLKAGTTTPSMSKYTDTVVWTVKVNAGA